LKKKLPYIIFFLSIILSTFLWENINLPFDPINSISGDSYFDNNHHSQNDTLRFVLFLSIPFFSFIFFLQIYEKKFFANIKNIFFKHDLFASENLSKLNLFFWITFFFIIMEFFSLDFKDFNYQLDIFHEGLWLTTSQNTKINNEFWNSSYLERGLLGNLYPYFLWKFFDLETIGISRFYNLFFILLNKVLLLLIALRITTIVNLEEKNKIIFYLLLSITFLTYTSYVSPVFFLRSFLLLVFILLMLNFIILKNSKIINLLTMGFLSSIGMLWYIDIGIYINCMLFLLLIILFFKKKKNYFFFLVSSILLSWLFLYLILPNGELNQFIINTKLLLTTIDYAHGLIFPTPFLSQDVRSTKALLLFLITGFFIIIGINKAQLKEFKFLLIVSFLFILSILYFKYGLSRSDGGHIRIASGFLYIPLFSIFYYKLINLISNQKINIISNNRLLNLILLTIFFSTIFLNKKFEDKSFLNIPSAKINIHKLINYQDFSFISKDYQDLLTYYDKISSNDVCVMTFTNEVAIPYLLKKPTCSKYYLLYLATPLKIQKSIAKDLSDKSPVFILYRSDIDVYGHVGKRLKLLDEFIRTEYDFFEKFKHWEIYKKK
jgi:hypothetical protein